MAAHVGPFHYLCPCLESQERPNEAVKNGLACTVSQTSLCLRLIALTHTLLSFTQEEPRVKILN